MRALAVWYVALACYVLITWHSAALVKVKEKLAYSVSKAMYHNFEEPNVTATVHARHLTVRSAYSEDRGQTITFLIEVNKSLLPRNSITGCSVGGHHTAILKTRTLYTNGPLAGRIIDDKPYLTHEMALVTCFGLPPVAENQGTKSVILYINPSGFLLPSQSERPLMILPPAVAGNGPYKILCCTAVVYGRPPYLKDWLVYQKAIGVDHVYMIAADSFMDLNQTYIRTAVSEGFLTVQIWREYLKSDVDIRYHSQLLAYQDCIFRFKHSYDYAMFADQDDFFVPLVPNTTLRYYIDKWCYNKGTCAFQWIEYHPECGMKDGPAVNGNLTSLLVSHTRVDRAQTKCIHKLTAVKEVGVHKAQEYVKGFGSVKVPKKEAYVAHLRHFDEKHLRPKEDC